MIVNYYINAFEIRLKTLPPPQVVNDHMSYSSNLIRIYQVQGK